MFLPNRLEKIPKKKQKNSKNTIMASFQAKIGWKRLREKIKIIAPFRSFPTGKRKFQKK